MRYINPITAIERMGATASAASSFIIEPLKKKQRKPQKNSDIVSNVMAKHSELENFMISSYLEYNLFCDSCTQNNEQNKFIFEQVLNRFL